jgi:hypothetical protein
MPVTSMLPPCELADDHLAQARPEHAFADLEPAAQEILRRMRDRARRAKMLVRLPDRLGWQDQHVEIAGQAGKHGLDEALANRGVGHDRKMRAMLLGGSGRQDRYRGIGIERREFARFQLRPEPFSRHDESRSAGLCGD